MNKTTENWIKNLNLEKHPEGGWFNEIYRSDEIIKKKNLPDRFSGDRNFSTSIYFLLTSEEISVFHKIKQDEIWYFHDGSSLTIQVIDEKGNHFRISLGKNISIGQKPQAVIKTGWIFAASVDNADSFSLVGCNVAPGFNFDDFEMPLEKKLLEEYPQHEKVIKQFTK